LQPLKLLLIVALVIIIIFNDDARIVDSGTQDSGLWTRWPSMKLICKALLCTTHR